MVKIKTITLLIVSCILAGCSSAPRDNSLELATSIVGQWEWGDGPENCKNITNMAFKSNGTYTRTSEDCQLADDGFGVFYYGWYVANNHICFVSVDAQFEDDIPRRKLYKKMFREEKDMGFRKGRCPWKIEKIEKSSVTITEIYDEEQPNSFIMIRKRWL